jgi:ankyrin repeat protein
MGLVAIVIAQADGSILNKFSQSYANYNISNEGKLINTEVVLENSLSRYKDFHHIKVFYNSIIQFPPNIKYDQLMKIALAEFDSFEKGARDYNIRCLLEFSAGTPLEYLNCTNQTSSFIGDIYTHILLNGGNLSFWNYLTITVPIENMNEEQMGIEFNKIKKLYLSGNVTSFESAINEGNYEISLSLIKQGLVSCELQNYEYKQSNLLLNSAKEFLKFNLRIELLLPEFLKYLFNFDSNEHASVRSFNSSIIKTMQVTKYNYTVNSDLVEKLLNERNEVASSGKSAREFLSEYISFSSLPLLTELAFSSCLLAPFFIIKGPLNSILALSLNAQYINFYKKFLFASDSVANYIKGDEFIWQMYLFDKYNYDSLMSSNSEKQNILHTSILSNDIEKAHSLLACDAKIVDNIVNFYDVKRYLPLHYACENGDLRITKALILKGSDVNAKIQPSYISSSFDIMFLLGKATYLYAYFTGWVKNDDLNEVVKLGALSSIYTVMQFFKIKFPDNLYYLSFIHRINPYNTWEDHLNKINQIYNGYNYDTPLHLSSKANHSDIVKYLLKQNNIDIKALNAKGESALHLAAANNNLEIIILLLENDLGINQRAYNMYYYPLCDLLIKLTTICFTSNSWAKTFSELVFLKVIHYDMFGSFHTIIGATPLHYALGSMNLSNINFHNNIINKSENISRKTIEYLIDNGADPDITMNYYGNYDLEIIPYIFAKLVISLNNKMPIIYKPMILLASQVIFSMVTSQKFFSYTNEELKPIDLIKENNETQNIYNLIKQYTVQNYYRDKNELSYLDIKYYFYQLNIISDNDNIYINEFGMYKGGSGKDVFHIGRNFEGQKDGFKVIIKDFKVNEDKIAIYGHNNINLTLQKDILFNKVATTIFLDDQPFITLAGVEVRDLAELSIGIF